MILQFASWTPFASVLQPAAAVTNRRFQILDGWAFLHYFDHLSLFLSLFRL